MELEVDAVRDWLVCCHREKENADVFLRHGYSRINKIRTEMTEHDYNEMGVDKFFPWRKVKCLKDIPDNEMSQELLVSVNQCKYYGGMYIGGNASVNP